MATALLFQELHADLGQQVRELAEYHCGGSRRYLVQACSGGRGKVLHLLSAFLHTHLIQRQCKIEPRVALQVKIRLFGMGSIIERRIVESSLQNLFMLHGICQR